MKLNIKLRQGFDNDKVSIKVNEREVYDKSGVTTDETIAFADSTEIDVDKKQANISITVGDESAKKAVDLEETPFVEVWRSADKLDIRTSKNEVPMM